MNATVNVTHPGRTRQRVRPGGDGAKDPREHLDVFGLGLAALAGVAYAWISFQLILGAILGVARATSDAGAYSISNGSMEPNLPVGAVIINTAVDPAGVVPEDDLPDTSNLPADGRDIGDLSLGNIRLFDVVTFEDPANPGQIITHRVVRIANGTFVTKGDANQDADSTPITFEHIKGKGRLAVPFVGRPAIWIGDGDYLPIGLWGASLLAAAALLVTEWERNRRNLAAAATLSPLNRSQPTRPQQAPIGNRSAPQRSSGVRTSNNTIDTDSSGVNPNDIAPIGRGGAIDVEGASRGDRHAAGNDPKSNHHTRPVSASEGALAVNAFRSGPSQQRQPDRFHSGSGVTVPIMVSIPNKNNGDAPITTVPILLTVPKAATVTTLHPVPTETRRAELSAEDWISFDWEAPSLEEPPTSSP